MTFTDPVLVHEPADGRAVPAAWGGTIRDDLEHLINPPACSVRHDASQLISTQSSADDDGEVLEAPDVWFDTSGMHSADEDSRINILEAGRYQVQAAVDFAAGNFQGYRVTVDLLVNGSQVVRGDSRWFAAQTTVHGVQVFRTLDLSAGDYVEVTVQHNAGVDRNVRLQEFTVILASTPIL